MRIKDLFGQQLSDVECDNKFQEYLNFYKSNWQVFTDVIPCLDLLKSLGYSLGIISNGQYNQQIEKLKGIGIFEYFDVIITSSEVGKVKPNKIIFLEACKKANVRIDDCYYVGDQLETDAVGSSKAGMRGVK